MEFLNRDRGNAPVRRRLRTIALIVGSCVFLATCAIFGGGDRPYAFSHAQHVVDGKLDCSVCHKMDEGTRMPSMPEPPLCLLCHKEADASKPQSRRIAVLFEDNVFQAQHAARLDDEIRFDHRTHVARGEDCSSCHTGILQNTRITQADGIAMEACMSCHASSGADQSCNVCHSEVDEGWQPPGHLHEWMRGHGRTIRMGTTLEAQRCDLCHTESTCVQCHSEEKPQNHDNFWRLRGHSVAASIDRRNCAACHRDDYCARCHSEVLPISHTGSFGSPRNTHCLGCHFPVGSQGCVTCHKSTPSHGQAPPKPPNHNPASNCRQCHGAGAPLVHVDDGSDCNLCHR